MRPLILIITLLSFKSVEAVQSYHLQTIDYCVNTTGLSYREARVFQQAVKTASIMMTKMVQAKFKRGRVTTNCLDLGNVVSVTNLDKYQGFSRTTFRTVKGSVHFVRNRITVDYGSVGFKTIGDFKALVLTLMHEFGHALGLEHTPNPKCLMFFKHNATQGLEVLDYRFKTITP